MGRTMRWGGARSGAILILLDFAATFVHAQNPFCLPGANPDHQPVFGTPSVRLDQEGAGTFVGGYATDAAFGDLNGDGLPDVAAALATGDESLSYVAVCMSLGNGVFAAPAWYSAGRGCCSVQIADFDHDGLSDLAVTNVLDDTVSILFNRGDGTFAPPVNYAVGHHPRSLKVGDLNGDGRPDIAVLNCFSNDVSILLNRGDGTFAPELRVFVGGVMQGGVPNLESPYPGPFLALGAFHGGGVLDIAVPGIEHTRILRNNGAGIFTLTPAADLPSAYCIAVADFNRDGNADLAAANGLARIVLGNGDGTFGPVTAYDVGPQAALSSGAIHVDAGDLDGDGYPDLAFGFESSYGQVVLLRNRGDGTFGPKEFVNSDDSDWHVALVDLRRRGKPDLVVVSPDQRSPLRVFLNDGLGTPLSYTSSLLSFPNYGTIDMAAADIDGDGILDLAITSVGGPYQVRLARGLGDGSFVSAGTMTFLPSGQSSGYGVELADLDGDHRPELIVADTVVPFGYSAPGRIWVSRNTGNFTFAAPARYDLTDMIPANSVAMDLNGDGAPDLAVWSCEVAVAGSNPPRQRAIQVLINRGDGTFDPPVAYPIGSTPFLPEGAVAVADLDRDGHPDLIGTVGGLDGVPGSVGILHNRGDGTFEPWQSIPVTAAPNGVIAIDVNSDGYPDLAVSHTPRPPYPPNGQPYLTILYNDGTGHFPTRRTYTDPNIYASSRISVADFDGDGRTDLALLEGGARGVLVLLNRGDGTLGEPVVYGAMNFWTSLVAGAFSGDPRPGIAVLRDAPEGEMVSFLPNLYCPHCYANCDASTTPPVLNIADFACFLNRFAAGEPVANCDQSTRPPTLNVNDFICFLNRFAAGCP